MRNLSRRISALEGAARPAEAREWDAALARLSTAELRALLADLGGASTDPARASLVTGALDTLARAGGAPAAAVSAMYPSGRLVEGAP